jgi:hypothetical protein
MALTYRDIQYDGGTGTSVSVSLTGVVENDVIIGIVWVASGHSAFSVPAGWEILDTADTGTGTAYGIIRFAETGESGSPSISWTTSSSYNAVLAVVYGNTYRRTVDVAALAYNGSSDASVPTMTPSEADQEVIAFFSSVNASSVTSTAPTTIGSNAWTEVLDAWDGAEFRHAGIYSTFYDSASATGSISSSKSTAGLLGYAFGIILERASLLHRGSEETATGTTDDVVIAVPSTTEEDDLLVAAIWKASAGVITPPSGWTQIDSASSIGEGSLIAWWKAASASEPTDYTFQYSTSDDYIAVMAAYQTNDIDMSSPIQFSADYPTNDGFVHLYETTSWTPAEAGQSMIMIGRRGSTGGTFSFAADTYNEDVDYDDGSNQLLFHNRVYPTTSSPGADAYTTRSPSATVEWNNIFFAAAFTAPPSPPSITDVDSDYGAASDEFDYDEDSLDINGSAFSASGNTVYISDASTLAGSANEVDISAAIQTEGATNINLDLTTLTTELADLEALGVGSLYVIVETVNGEDSLAVTVHRAKAFNLSASSNITASGENTTAQLAAPSGKTTGDFAGGRIQDDENPTDGVTTGDLEYREDEWSLAAVTPSDGTYLGAQTGETYQFRVLINGVVADTVTVTPQWIVDTAATGAVSGSADLRLDATATATAVGIATGQADLRLDATATLTATGIATGQADLRLDAVAVAETVHEQEGFRFYADDAAPGSATPLAAQDTSIDLAVDTPARVRVLTNVSGSESTSTALTIQYKRDDEADSEWRDV